MSAKNPTRNYKATIFRDATMCYVPVPFDPKAVFGKVRAPVKVTLNGYTFRSTIASMGGSFLIPLRRSNREAAGLEGGETLDIRLDLDTEKREVELPADFARALRAQSGAMECWRGLSYTHQREHVEAIEQAVKAETRTRRIEKALAWLQSKKRQVPAP